MLDGKGFDSWAYEYDESVRTCDEKGEYPFDGYREVLNRIEELIPAGQDVLDVGLGTAVLTKRLYDKGCRIWGQDYSDTMLQIASEKMPDAALFFGDLADGLADPLKDPRFDTIVATYALHHFTAEQKVKLLRELRGHLKPGGRILIGDIAFPTSAQQDACRTKYAAQWDEDEIYIVYDELKQAFPDLACEQISQCCCLFVLPAEDGEQERKSPVGIRIEQASSADAAAILEFTKICGAETDNLSFGAAGIPVSAEEEAAYLDSVLASEKDVFFVAKDGETIVGTANYSTFPRSRMAHRGEVGMSVRKAYWNRGVGTQLMEKILEFAKESAGADIVSLEVRSDNAAAIHLYEKFGFEKIGTFRGYFKIDGELIDFDIMERML